jgi:two-component system chemotaxis response regulator CheB
MVEVAMDHIRILIVDDSLTIRAMIESLLEKDRSLHIVGVARNAEETFHLIEETNPDVVTLDIAMPGKNGMEILDDIMATTPRPVIMLSSLMREGDIMIETALQHGAEGCFNKSKIVQESVKLVKLIKHAAAQRVKYREAAMRGERYFPHHHHHSHHHDEHPQTES